jgi:hypothetical protein
MVDGLPQTKADLKAVWRFSTAQASKKTIAS